MCKQHIYQALTYRKTQTISILNKEMIKHFPRRPYLAILEGIEKNLHHGG